MMPLTIKQGGLGLVSNQQFSIVIAYKEDSMQRQMIFDWMIHRYKTLFPAAEIIIGNDTTGEQDFCKSNAINNAVYKSNYDTLLITDIDLILDTEAIIKGIKQAHLYAFIIPYGYWWRLSQETTNNILNSSAVEFSLSDYTPDGNKCKVDICRGTGIHILTKHNYYLSGGYDERFVGWGGEDNAFGCALKTLCKGAPKILKQYNSYHLWHPSQSTKGKKMRKENVRLWRAYQSAMRNKDMMQDLINSRTW